MSISPVKAFAQESIEAQAYAIVEKYKENIPRINDRNRLGFNLVKNLLGEGDDPIIIVKTNKLVLEGITEKELADHLIEDLASVKFPNKDEDAS